MNKDNPTLPQPNRNHSGSIDRQAAAQVIRGRIQSLYDHTPVQPANTADDTQNPYQRTHTPEQQYDWGQYHSAWQKYYQEYYQRYYQQELQNARLQIGHAATTATGNSLDHVPSVASPNQNRAAFIKNSLLTTIRDRAVTVRKSSHFIPMLCGLLVVGLFAFLQYNRVLVAGVKAYVSPGSSINETDTILVDPTATQKVGPEPLLIIPKINLNVPVVYDEPSMQDSAIQKALERGVVHYNIPGANSLPGQAGNLVIGGHSSNDVFDGGGYKFAFVLIDRLQPGDIFYINYQGIRYIYRVTEKKVIEPNELSVLQVTTSKPIATLVTCTPTGTALKRLLVFAEQISPDPAAAVAQTPAQDQKQQPANLPGNSPTLLQRLQDLIF